MWQAHVVHKFMNPLKTLLTVVHRLFASVALTEGREGVKWELGFAFFRGWEMGFCALGLGFMKEKTIEKWE